MAFWKWSKTAGSNASADTTINWAEGQAPSSVNDSARAMMARIAEWRDDVSGTITTVGTAANYQVTSNQGFDNLADMNGAMIAFVPHVTNVAICTLNVDSLGFKPLRFGPNLELQSGVLIQGTPYVASYNNADGVWYLQGGFANPYGVPLGAMMPYTAASAPNSAFVIPIGQAISRTTCATYFSLAGTTFGAGDGSTTFNIPDMRGRAVFGLDNGGAARITAVGGNFDGNILGNTGGSQSHTLTTAEMPVHSHGVTDPGHAHSYTVRNNFAQAAGSGILNLWETDGGANTGTSATGVSIQNAGSGNAHTILPPAMTLPYILRVI